MYIYTLYINKNTEKEIESNTKHFGRGLELLISGHWSKGLVFHLYNGYEYGREVSYCRLYLWIISPVK
jgi:hypothetical protein